MKNKIRDFILKTIAVIFSILFAIVLFNTIFFNKTIGINYKIPVIIIFTIIVYGIILFLYYIYTKKEMKFLDYSPKKIYYFIFIAIIFIVQFIIAKLVYGEYGWDCGEIIKDSYLFTNNGYFNFPYYAQYPNNIGIFLIINKVLEISKNFIDIKIIENCFLSSIVFNIIMVDLASLFTFLTIKKVSGNKSAYLSLMFILPLMIFSPYINIPYTDTISMMFPILILYLYICIKELPKEKFQKYLLALLMGIVTVVGTLLKPTVIIMPIAIFIISILNINKVGLKNIAYTLILCVFFIVGVGFSYLGYSVQKEKFFNELISEEMSYDLEISYMHFLMMGMQEKPNDTKEDGKNQTLYGAYNGTDVENTNSIKGYKEKQNYNLKIVKERLKSFGIVGYIKFLYNKANWILSDGTFYYGYEGTWLVNGYSNKSEPAKRIQKFITVTTKEYKNITANIMQIAWIIISIGLVFSISKEKNEYIDIGKLAIIGIVLFLLLFEGRARYLINHIPIFILVGTYGLKNSLNKILLTLEHK